MCSCVDARGRFHVGPNFLDPCHYIAAIDDEVGEILATGQHDAPGFVRIAISPCPGRRRARLIMVEREE